LLWYFFWYTKKECHDTCNNCTNGTNIGCINCPLFKYLYEGKCLSSCPIKTFTYEGLLPRCIKCVSPCEACLGEDFCLTCAQGFFWNKENGKCVLADDCPPGTYADFDARACNKCAFECLTCYGETNKECIICNFINGYDRGNGGITEACLMLLCQDGNYLLRDYELQKSYCMQCDPTCKTCNGEGPYKCTECKKNLKPVRSPYGNGTLCKSCEQLHEGYYTGSDGSCVGILYK